MKPILSKISVFNATEDHSFQFGAYADIDLVAFIVFQSKDSTVYKFGTVAPTGTGLARQFVIKADVLKNQHDPYYIMIRCRLTGTNTFSEYSDKMLFYCHEKPSISFTAFTKHQGIFGIIWGSTNKSVTMTTPSYNFDCKYTYKTAEGEVLNRYEYYLYDANKELVKKSECLYHRDSMKSFHVEGLDNNSTYYVRAKAESVGGYQLDTGYKMFTTKYSEQTDGTNITAINNKYDGSISLFAKCPSTADSGITHVRFKRRKAGGTWMTIYEKTVDMKNDLLLFPEWMDGFVSQSGVMVSDNVATSTALIPVADLKSLTISDKNYTARVAAYDKDSKFLGYYDAKVHKVFGSISSIIFGIDLNKTVVGSWSFDSWDVDYKDNIANLRVSIIPNNGITTKFDNSKYALKLHTATSGAIVLEHTDWYAAGRNREYQYAVAPVINTMEQAYIITKVTSYFDGAIITDGDTAYHITLEPTVESVELTRTASIVETLGNKYPYLYFGNEANYYTGDFSGVGIEWNKEDDSFDVDGGNDYRKALSDWLTNGEAKVLKMSDGREWLIGVNGNVKITCSDHIDKGTLEFSFVEIGDIESEEDMYNNGLSEYLPVGGTA